MTGPFFLRSRCGSFRTWSMLASQECAYWQKSTSSYVVSARLIMPLCEQQIFYKIFCKGLGGCYGMLHHEGLGHGGFLQGIQHIVHGVDSLNSMLLDVRERSAQRVQHHRHPLSLATSWGNPYTPGNGMQHLLLSSLLADLVTHPHPRKSKRSSVSNKWHLNLVPSIQRQQYSKKASNSVAQGWYV